MKGRQTSNANVVLMKLTVQLEQPGTNTLLQTGRKVFGDPWTKPKSDNGARRKLKEKLSKINQKHYSYIQL